MYVIQFCWQQAVGKPLWHTSLLFVQWKTPDDRQRNCLKHVDFYSKNKFEKLVHLICFIIRRNNLHFVENKAEIRQHVLKNSKYSLTYSMVQSHSWEANWFAASQEIPRISGNRRFITALTSIRHPSLSWAIPIQSIYPQPTSWRSILMLSTHLRLGLPSGLLPSGFPTKTLYTPFSSPIRAACPAHLIEKQWINILVH